MIIHKTVRTGTDKMIEEEIDKAISLYILQCEVDPTLSNIRLHAASPFFRSDGVCFVTILLEVEKNYE